MVWLYLYGAVGVVLAGMTCHNIWKNPRIDGVDFIGHALLMFLIWPVCVVYGSLWWLADLIDRARGFDD